MKLNMLKRNRDRSRRGASSVEFGLTVIPLFVIILGSMEYAWFFCHKLVMDAVVQEVSYEASVHLSGDSTDTNTIGRSWEEDGIAMWKSSGMPGTPQFDTVVQTSGGVYLVHVTGTMEYNGFVDGFFDLTQLPGEVSMTAAKRAEDQDLASVLSMFGA